MAGLLLAAALLPPSAAHAQWQENGVAVCAETGDQSAPVIVADAQGGAYVVWEDARTLPAQVYAQHLDALGQPLWAAGGIRVSSGTYSQTKPVAVGDGVGGVVIAWILEIVPGAREARGQRLDAAGVAQWAAGGIPVSPGAAFPVQLAIISDGRAPVITTPGVILAWTDIRSGLTTDIYARALDSAGGVRWDAAVCTAAGNQVDLVMVSDGSASAITLPRGAILAWRDRRVAEDEPDIYAQRLNSSGMPQWTIDGQPVDARDSNVQEPVLVRAGAGTAIVAWPGPGPSRTFALWAQRIGTLGSWPGDGVLVAPPGGNQTSPAAMADGAGGLVIAWSSIGPGLQRDLFGQRLDANGAPVWGASGITVCGVTPGGQNEPVVVPARDLGAVVAWEDTRPATHSDVYAQLLSSTGVPQWNPDGVPLCTAPGYQFDLAAVSDTTGGAIVAWVDERSGGRDIYAQRITGLGGVVAVEPGSGGLAPASGLRLGAPFPNPTRTGLSLSFDLPRAGEVSAGILDVAGRRVRTLLSRRALPAGAQVLAWDGESDGGRRLPPGVYWVVVRAGAEEGRRRAVVLP
jgi:hypothetical protein